LTYPLRGGFANLLAERVSKNPYITHAFSYRGTL
jgi:hypothetical protein